MINASRISEAALVRSHAFGPASGVGQRVADVDQAQGQIGLVLCDRRIDRRQVLLDRPGLGVGCKCLGRSSCRREEVSDGVVGLRQRGTVAGDVGMSGGERLFDLACLLIGC